MHTFLIVIYLLNMILSLIGAIGSYKDNEDWYGYGSACGGWFCALLAQFQVA